MFEDNPQNQAGAPHNLPTEPDDIFAAVDEPPMPAPGVAGAGSADALSAGLLKKKMAAPATLNSPLNGAEGVGTLVAPVSYATKEPILGKVIMFVVAALVLGALGFAGYWVYGKYIKQDNVFTTQFPVSESLPTPVVPTVEPEPSIPVPEQSMPVADPVSTTTADLSTKAQNDNILFGQQPDSDQDGLSDLMEKQLGTNANNTDSDRDGLTDGDEMLVWHTDPLSADSDGDSFGDGTEVKNGYNPMGPGKLAVTSSPATDSKNSATSTQ